MPFRLHIQAPLVHIEWYGELVNADFTRFLTELPKIGRQLGYAPNLLHTFDEVTDAHLHYDEANAQAEHRSRIALPNKIRSATVANRPLIYGFTRMFITLNSNPDIEMQVFSSQEEAHAWLRQNEIPGKRRLGGRPPEGEGENKKACL